MADELKAPDALSEVNAIKPSDNIKQFVTELHKEVEEVSTLRSEWETRQDDYERKRYGIRTKKSFPWVGAANFILPQIDSDINRLKPAYVNLAFGISPVVMFEPFGPEDVEAARKREKVFDWRLRTQVPMFREYNLGTDYALQRGYTVFKTGWKFETRTYVKYLELQDLDQEVLEAIFMPEITDEIIFHIIAEAMRPDLTFQENVDEIQDAIKEFREGKTKFEFSFVEKASNCADIKALDPRDEVYFPIGTTDIQKAAFIDHRFWMSKNDIKVGIKSGRFSKFSDEDIDSWTTKSYSRETSDTIKSIRDGVSLDRRQDDMVYMHEVWTWYDVNGDGIDEKVCTTYPDSDPQAVLRFIENPYDHGQFPFVAVRRELNDAEIMSSRGIAALDDDFQTGISTLFNQDIDAGTIMNTPTVVARKNSVKNLRNLRYVPGQVVETENGTADYTVVQNTNFAQVNKFNSMQYLKAWANERIGNPVAAMSQINNSPGQGAMGAKTATEVTAIQAQSGQLQSLDVMVWQSQMSDVYYQLDALYDQFGDEEESFITNEGPVKTSRQELQGKFNLVPNGRLDNTNPVLRAQKALSLLQLFNGDPFVKQYELRKFYIDDVDWRLSGRLMKSPQEIAMEQAHQAQMSAQTEAQELQKSIGLKRIQDSLELDKERKLSIIQGKKYAEG